MKRVRLGALLLFAAWSAVPANAADAPITEADLRAHIEILASDAYEGRAPGTPGETKAITYIAQQWASSGLKGGLSDGSWYQPVGLGEHRVTQSHMTLSGKGAKMDFGGDEVMLWTDLPSAGFKRLPMIFTGTGVDAQGRVIGDVRGKAVLVLLSDPVTRKRIDTAAVSSALATAGAKAMLQLAPEVFPWDGFKRAYAARVRLNPDQPGLPVEGVMRASAAAALFSANGLDLAKLSADAGKSGFRPVALRSRANLAAASEGRRFNSYNIVAKLPGKQGAAHGALLFLGHWDHFGICRDESEEDRICNGAVDNASGMAVLIEAARRLGRGPQLDRDIYFLGTTAEEKGLLGAKAFVENPPIPLERIVAAFNIDTIAVAPKGEKVAIIGRGTTGLDSDIDRVTVRMGRKVEMGTDSNVMIQRQDGWALKARGVPAVMVSGSFADMKKLEAYLGADYHGPKDEANDKLELGGAAEDADLHVALARHFGSLKEWPGPVLAPAVQP